MYPSSEVFPGDDVFPDWGLAVTWDDPNKRTFTSGCDRGALYLDTGAVAWNGLLGVDETGEVSTSVLYRDGVVYYADGEPSDFTAQVKAYFWPEEFSEALGMAEAADGFYVDNQKPKSFGFSYRTLVGSGGKGDRFAYQIHLVYNAIASLGTRSRKTRGNTVTLDEFTFNLVCVPVKLPGFRPSAHYILDTRNMDATSVAELEHILYIEGRLPDPLELYDLLNFGDAITFTITGPDTWVARGSRENIIDNENGTWTIKNVNGVSNGDGTFTLQDTP